jgi:hypothetical protein
MITYKSQNQHLIIYNQVIDYLQLRYVVIINNHDLVLIIYRVVRWNILGDCRNLFIAFLFYW